MGFLRAFLIALLFLLIVIGTFFGGYFVRQELDKPMDLPILNEAHDILVSHGLKDPPPPPALEYGMIRGMLQAYDEPNTQFLEPPQNELQSNALEGKYGGIGVETIKDLEGYWVLTPFPNSPAWKAGVQGGDRLLGVDEQSIDSQTSVDIVHSALSGPTGEMVRLTLGRPPIYEPFQLAIKREEIPLPSVVWYIQPGENRLGVLKVNLIAASTTNEIQNAVEDLQKHGATYFVLDLRENPGGLLTAGVDLARLFLKEGVVMEQKYKGKDTETFKVEKSGPLLNLLLVVLINQNTASAAEITAGALKARQRAVLIGTPSHGKDTVQLVFNLEDGSSLYVTAAKWWIPGIEPPLAGQGLQPDIPVNVSSAAHTVDPFIQAAIQHFFGKR